MTPNPLLSLRAVGAAISLIIIPLILPAQTDFVEQVIRVPGGSYKAQLPKSWLFQKSLNGAELAAIAPKTDKLWSPGVFIHYFPKNNSMGPATMDDFYRTHGCHDTGQECVNKKSTNQGGLHSLQFQTRQTRRLKEQLGDDFSIERIHNETIVYDYHLIKQPNGFLALRYCATEAEFPLHQAVFAKLVDSIELSRQPSNKTTSFPILPIWITLTALLLASSLFYRTFQQK